MIHQRSPHMGGRRARHRKGSGAAAVLFLVSLLALPGEKVHAMSNIQCEIRSRPVSGGVELTGVIYASRELRGDYRFAVESRGAGGSSNIVQSGLFSLRPDEPRVVGAIMVNSGSGSSFVARLSVRSDEGETCVAHN